MRRILFAVALAGFPALAAAADVDGVWATEKNEDGGYLEIAMAPCASDGSLTCGTVSKAFKASGEDPGYADLGKAIIKDMKHDGGGSYSGGTIWDPENGKTYDLKMTLKGSELDVDGCVSFFCQGQHWKRVSQ